MIRSFMPGTGSRRRNTVLVSAGVAACAAAGVLTLVGTASAASPPAARTRHSCRNATLKGTYIYYNDGWAVSGAGRSRFPSPAWITSTAGAPVTA